MMDKKAFVVGTFDTKSEELGLMKSMIEIAGVPVVTIDLSTASGYASSADVTPNEVAQHHPEGPDAVFTGDRGTAVGGMATALENFVGTRTDIGGIIAAGGTGGTALATPAMRALPVGVPKVMLSTVASGNVRPYVGPSDICMMYSVTDVQGINRISHKVMVNAAHALAGMLANDTPEIVASKPAIGLTMFGVTTPCVQAVSKALEPDYDCLVFHATGVGGQSMEKLVDSNLLEVVLDITTTEVADHLMGGVFSAGEGRMDAIIRSGVPYVGSCGALDMVNFGAQDTVPKKYEGRKFHVHNPQVTLMRTTPEENAEMGRWIAAKLNQMNGPVRFLLPAKGVSVIDVPDMPFHDPVADAALFGALEANVTQTPSRKLLRVDAAINDDAFVEALLAAFRDIAG